MTLQQTPERRPAIIDINLLPSEYQHAKKPLIGPILYLVVLVLICVLAAIVILKLGVDSDIKSKNQTLTNLQQQLVALQVNKAEADPIKAQITDAQNQLANIETDYQSFLEDQYPRHSEFIAEVDDLVPGNKITLANIGGGLSGDGRQEINIVGTATKRIYVYDYALVLEESDFFDTVDFEFGDCPETDNCNFTITAFLSTMNQTAGETNE